MAVVDLLPSGFELVLNRGSDVQGLDRLVSGTATWRPDYLDAREDRVNFYGTINTGLGELKYKLKAVAKDTFVLPPSQATGMYDPKIIGRSKAATVTVE
jgi:uncharacterized protein YfaS (alpha-2-macroglobulin family)